MCGTGLHEEADRWGLGCCGAATLTRHSHPSPYPPPHPRPRPNRLFDSFDADGSGEIDYHELHAAIKARKAKKASTAKTLELPPWNSSPVFEKELRYRPRET